MKTYLVKRNDNWVIENRSHAPHDAEFYPCPPNEEAAWLDIIDIKESYTEQVPILDDEGNETGEYEEVVHETVVGKEAVVNEARKAEVLNDREVEESKALLEEQRQADREYLNSTDWYLIRQMETGVPVPEEILEARQAARARL